MNDRLYYSREAEAYAQRKQLVLVMVVTSVSLSIGALLALLLAPRSGEEIRRILGEQLDGAYSAGRDLADNVRREVEGRVQDARS